MQVGRRVPTDGIVMVTRQRVRVGRAHAGKVVTILVGDTHLRVLHNGEELSLHPLVDNRPVIRFRAAPFRFHLARAARAAAAIHDARGAAS
jgi:biopolymer transport protein ExbB